MKEVKMTPVEPVREQDAEELLDATIRMTATIVKE